MPHKKENWEKPKCEKASKKKKKKVLFPPLGQQGVRVVRVRGEVIQP